MIEVVKKRGLNKPTPEEAERFERIRKAKRVLTQREEAFLHGLWIDRKVYAARNLLIEKHIPGIAGGASFADPATTLPTLRRRRGGAHCRSRLRC